MVVSPKDTISFILSQPDSINESMEFITDLGPIPLTSTETLRMSHAAL